jgi:sulfur carrier protein
MNRSESLPAEPAEPAQSDAPADAPAGEWVLVNGRRAALPATGRLADLLLEMDVTSQTKGVAVALNDDLVPRGQWSGQALQPGDRIEVVRAVQGG